MQPSYQTLFETSRRINWRVDDIIGADKRLDFSKPFLPESFAKTAPLWFLAPQERLALNHIRAFGYLSMFELVETFILPFVTEQAVEQADDDPFRAPALKQFASEEAKHIALFKAFRRDFEAGFGVECGFIGPAHAIGRAVLAHTPLAVAIVVLAIEWMSQSHYVESVKDDQDLDPQFKSLLKHHWMEEAQHAKLDGLILEAMVRHTSAEEIGRAVDEYVQICAFLDGGLKQQTVLDLDSFERAVARALPKDHRAEFLEVQHQALRWTFLGSAVRNHSFLGAIGRLSGDARARIEASATAFC
jgi:P-aminobenzoate N-oxygenase AurF